MSKSGGDQPVPSKHARPKAASTTVESAATTPVAAMPTLKTIPARKSESRTESASTDSRSQPQPPRKPLVWAVIFLIVGILLHRIVPIIPHLWLAWSAALIFTSLALIRFTRISIPLLAIGIIFLGLAATQIEHFQFAANHIANFSTDQSRIVQVECIVESTPRTIQGQSIPGGRPVSARQSLRVSVTKIQTRTGWIDATGQAVLRIDEPVESLSQGHHFRALAYLYRSAPADNPGQMDWQQYYRDLRMPAQLQIPSAANLQIIGQQNPGPIAFLKQATRNALEKGFTDSQSLDRALLRTLLVGDNDQQLYDIQEDFRKTGTSHHLSISGTHIAVLGGFIFLLCRLVRLSPRNSAVITMSFILLYGTVATSSPPVVRSVIISMVIGMGMVLKRSVDNLHLLAVTLFAMLIVCPLDLYNAGFQLSFGTVLGLVLFADPLNSLFKKNEDIDARVLRSFGYLPSRSKRLVNSIRHTLLIAVSASVVAWAVSSPIIIQHFDQYNPWQIPATIAMSIPVFAAMLVGLCKIILTLLCPGLAAVWASVAILPVTFMRHCVHWLAQLPGSDIPLPALSIFIIAIYYALLCLPLLRTVNPRVRLTFRTAAVTACALPLLLGLVLKTHQQPGTHITLLSVGAGQCAVITTPNGQTKLIDAGSSTYHDIARQTLAPFFRSKGISRIDRIFISHPNLDHYSAIESLADAMPIGQIYLTQTFLDAASDSYAVRHLLAQLRQKKIPVLTTRAGQFFILDNNIQLQSLWPNFTPTRIDANETSQVLRLTCANKSILFTGDIQAYAQERLLLDKPALISDILIAPHHGSFEKTTAAFVNAAQPQYVLASNDRSLSGKQRSFNDLLKKNPPLRTSDTGAITIHIDPDGQLRLEPFRK